MNDFILGVVVAVVAIFVIAMVIGIVMVSRKVRALEYELRAQENTMNDISRSTYASITELYRNMELKETNDSSILGELHSYIDSRFDKFENKLKQKTTVKA